MKKKIKIEGMTCQHCINSVKAAIESIDGVEFCKVKTGKAVIETCLMGPEQVLELEQSIVSGIKEAGYTVISIK